LDTEHFFRELQISKFSICAHLRKSAASGFAFPITAMSAIARDLGDESSRFPISE